MEESFKPVGAFIEIKTTEKPGMCEKHGEFISKGYKLTNSTHWTQCPTCNKEEHTAALAHEAEVQARREQDRMEERLSRSGIPLRFRSKDFASFIADTEAKDRALTVATEFAQNFDQHKRNGTVVVFSGLPGTGKSHLAIAIAQAVMAKHTALYTSAIDAVRMIRETWRRDSDKTETEVLDRLSSVGLLVLDEVGVQYGTEAEQINLFDIIDKRYRDMMPTILLTNQNKKGMKEFLGDRSFDRLREGGLWVTFDWQSQRGNQ